MSGLPRKYLSGAAKRKLAEKKKCVLQDNSESAKQGMLEN